VINIYSKKSKNYAPHGVEPGFRAIECSALTAALG
jgi:hypothetical protein